jgi:predicted RNase H-like nuclease
VEVIGLDACRGKWLAVALGDGRFVEARFGSAADLIGHWPKAAAIGVDIPIGVPEASPGRDADRAAREFVGERRSSVFPTFPSVVLKAPTYPAAKAICVERGWPKPSIQSYGMRHRIFEIDRLATADERIIEDVLDAAVVAWTAIRYVRGEALPLPETHEDRIGAIWR